jgi:neutral ceramidase
MKDGTVRSNPGHMNPEVVEPAGPIDPEVGVLSCRREAGRAADEIGESAIEASLADGSVRE